MAKVIDIITGEMVEEPSLDALPSRGAPILVDHFLAEAQPTRWVVADRIAESALTVLAGVAKKSRKTTQLLWLLEAAARGEPWLGHATSSRETYFVGFEGGRGFLAHKIKEIGHALPLYENDLPTPCHAATGTDGYDWMLARLEQAAKAKKPWPVLIIVDTLSQVFAVKGINENDNMEVTNYLRRIDELAQQTRAAILFAHHFSKYHFQMRGASSISAICNWCEIKVKEEKDGEVILWLDWTLRHGPDGADAVRIGKPNGTFTFETMDLKDVPRKSKAAERPEKIRIAVFEAFRARSGEDVTLSFLRAAVSEAMGGKGNVSEKLVRATTSKLGEDGMRDGTYLIRGVEGAGEPCWRLEPTAAKVERPDPKVE